MNWTIIVPICISILSVGAAIYFGIQNKRRNDKADDSTSGKQDGILMTEIGYIKSGVDDIKRKQEKQDEQHIEVVSRLTAVEASTKQAHHRIDGIEEKIIKGVS